MDADIVTELLSCYDCSNAVSPNARACPHCGSTFPAGPARVGRRDSRTIGAEQRNDETLLGMFVLCIGIGFFFGAVTSGILAAVDYGFVGAVIGVPAGFIINVTRNWR
jgi:hypothetical protein